MVADALTLCMWLQGISDYDTDQVEYVGFLVLFEEGVQLPVSC